MFKKKPILKYESAVDFYDDIFSTAKKNIPKWYKSVPKLIKTDELNFQGEPFRRSVKSCVPFLEALTVGYTINLPYDLFVTKNQDGGPYVYWRVNEEYAPSWRQNPANLELVPLNHFDTEYTWKLNCSFVVPEGYSMLLTHPLNRYDLPFTTLSGVVDGGYVTMYDGSVPFYIKKDFEGLIPQGTPILQIIPFYNETWSSKKEHGLLKESDKNNRKTKSLMVGWYKKTFWKRKNYN